MYLFIKNVLGFIKNRRGKVCEDDSLVRCANLACTKCILSQTNPYLVLFYGTPQMNYDFVV